MTKTRLSVLFACVAVLVPSTVPAADSASRGFDPSTWLQDSGGMFDAIRSVEEESKPMVVYFYTDWCGYCRQFERELLGTEEVKEYFSEVLAVRINPENGDREREIAAYYGVTGYPGFFVHSGTSRTLSRVDRMLVENGQPRLMAPEEFIAACRRAASR